MFKRIYFSKYFLPLRAKSAQPWKLNVSTSRLSPTLRNRISLQFLKILTSFTNMTPKPKDIPKEKLIACRDTYFCS